MNYFNFLPPSLMMFILLSSSDLLASGSPLGSTTVVPPGSGEGYDPPSTEHDMIVFSELMSAHSLADHPAQQQPPQNGDDNEQLTKSRNGVHEPLRSPKIRQELES